MNFKRKRSRRQVRCTLCTKLRWYGNAKERKRASDLRNDAKSKEGTAMT